MHNNKLAVNNNLDDLKKPTKKNDSAAMFGNFNIQVKIDTGFPELMQLAPKK